jgi:tetratricopeptide (TPR) repeat protein
MKQWYGAYSAAVAMRDMRASGAVAVLGALAGLSVAAGWSLRVAWADHLVRQETLEATEKALWWTPGQAAYHFRLGMLSAEKEPARSTAALERAVALNPEDSGSWTELGLRLEADGKVNGGEQCLLRAAEVDRQYLPRWSLANFYFRRRDERRFWAWAKSAAEMVYGDATPLFRLCGQVTEDGELIERIGIERPDLRGNYVSYLMERGRVDIMLPAARKILEGNRAADVPVMIEACNRLIDRKRAEEAMEIWNLLAEQHRIPFGKVSVRGPNLTNGTFSTAPTSQGFDWRLPPTEGVSPSSEDRPPGLHLTFSGKQPEGCGLLAQFVPTREETAYELKFAYRTQGIQPDTGLRWRVIDASSGGTLAEGKSLSSEEEQSGAVHFRTPARCRVVRIALEYERTAGTTRIVGFLVLRNVDVRTARYSPPDEPLRSRVR